MDVKGGTLPVTRAAISQEMECEGEIGKEVRKRGDKADISAHCPHCAGQNAPYGHVLIQRTYLSCVCL